ncbi:GNAT family N-acetyltransferase [Chryseobacterium sp. POL2]|uniref:GNAT family N-acetyltransferase n=1 Tax=Chryseobacterium sp. POL2 TaxID=2713414 RepID=UPI001E379B02|nr:GNAT family N-acetyltransferase [Chryseobacterium sp. POL2]
MMLKAFETERLLLRPLEESDAARLFLLDSNPEVMKYVGVDTLSKEEESLEVIRMIRKQYDDFGVGRYAVVEKNTGLLIGWSGLKFNNNSVNEHQDFYELGYRFLPEYWGKGYASESAVAFIKAFFTVLKKGNLYAYAHSENEASKHVLRKLGFNEIGTFDEPDGKCFWYEMTPADFKIQYFK